MRHRHKLALAALAAAFMLANAVSVATANRLSTNEREIDVIWRDLAFRSGESVGIECPVTLLGSFHSNTIREVNKALIGAIRHAQVGRPNQCTGGEVTILQNTLPWHIIYDSFSGTLPRITGISLLVTRASFDIENTEGLDCLVVGTAANPHRAIASLNEATGQVTGIRADEGASIPLGSQDFLCNFASGQNQGTGAVTRLNGGLVTIRLI